MYEIPWSGIIGVLVGFIVLVALYIRHLGKKKNQRGTLDLTKLVVTPRKNNNKDIKLM